MNIKRIVANIASYKMEESRKFYCDFLGLDVVINTEELLTFASPINQLEQISVVKKDKEVVANFDITISMETDDIDSLYKKAMELDYKIAYPIKNESWGVRRFYVIDPNGVIVNITCQIPVK